MDEERVVAETLDGRTVFVLYRSERFLTLVPAPEDVAVGDAAMVSTGEGPYAIVEHAAHSHQRRIEHYLLRRPGQSLDQALDDAGLDEEFLLPRY